MKDAVRAHWEAETAGVRYGDASNLQAFYRQVRERRYELEPYIPDFAGFANLQDKRVLEIGVGGGVDFSNFVLNGAIATGVDFTRAALEHAEAQLRLVGAGQADFTLRRADAEDLPFPDHTYDLVYSWGVLHHTPDTPRAFSEALRVLKPGGTLKAMVYHTPSWTGWMLWVLYALMRGRPWMSPRRCVHEHLESPGTKAYTLSEIQGLLAETGFTAIKTSTKLGPGDLLTIRPSDRYRSLSARLAWKLYPRWLVRAAGDRFGLFLLIEATRPASS